MKWILIALAYAWFGTPIAVTLVEEDEQPTVIAPTAPPATGWICDNPSGCYIQGMQWGGEITLFKFRSGDFVPDEPDGPDEPLYFPPGPNTGWSRVH